MDWTRILKDAGIADSPGYRETVEKMRKKKEERAAARLAELQQKNEVALGKVQQQAHAEAKRRKKYV